MPFTTDSAPEKKQQFIQDWLAKLWPFSTLCKNYDISQPTGYKWIKGYRQEGMSGMSGLCERSRQPLEHPNAVGAEVVELILAGRAKHPSWGAKKLVAWIKRREGLTRLCAVSTAGEILRRHELVVPRQLHRRCVPSQTPMAA